MHEEEERAARGGFYGSLAAFAVVALVTLFGAHGCTPRAVEAKLQARAEAALAKAGHTSVVVEMDGQRAVLGGLAPSDSAKKAAAGVALTAAGAGGAWPGGVTSVANQITVGKPVSPFTWSAVRTSDQLILRGYAPTARVRAQLSDTARDLFKLKIVDETAVAAGAPPGGEWDEVASGALQQLARLERGEARMTDAQLVIMGEASRATAEAVRAHYQKGLPTPYQSIVDVLAPGERLAIPELAAIDLSNADAGDCQRAFSELLLRNTINFDVGSALISSSSRALLDTLAQVARRCDRYTIAIGGHTDNTGERALNMELSRARAAAVRDYLVGRGVTAARLSAAGFGPDRPRANNRTEAGRAANRRIEFTVSA